MYGFNWQEFLSQRGIAFVERGPSVTKNHVAIRCPFCGAADPSHHMSLSLVNSYWRCWRDNSHAGRNPARLVAKLIGCSWHEAMRIVGQDQLDIPQQINLQDLLRRVEAKDVRMERPKTMTLLPEFFPLHTQPRTTAKQRMLNYLEDRGFHKPVLLARSYDLRGCLTDEYAHRIIVPLYQGNQLFGWTARAIGVSKIRYLTHGSVRDMLFEPPRVEEGGKTLIIVEGPFDALKVDCYGREHGARAVALLGLDPSPGRLARLAALAPRYRRVGVCLDRGAEAPALRLQAALAGAGGARLVRLPGGRKDPGELTPVEVAVLSQAPY